MFRLFGGGAVHRYRFTSTVSDLLEAEEAERTARSVRAPFRWVISLLGVAWLVTGLFTLSFSSPSWRPVAWIILGVGVLYYFAIRPYQRRSRIRETNAPEQDIAVEFDDDCIKLEIGNVGNFARGWDELVGFIDARKGIVFYFSDGVVNWLPNRVFSDKTERDGLVAFVQGRQSRELDQPERDRPE